MERIAAWRLGATPAERAPSGLQLFNAILIIRWVSLGVGSIGYAWNYLSGGSQPYGSFVPAATACVLYTLVVTLFAPQVYRLHLRSWLFQTLDYAVTFAALSLTGVVWTPMLVFAGCTALFAGLRGKPRHGIVAGAILVAVYFASLAAKGLTYADLVANEGADLAIVYSLEFLAFPTIWAYSASLLERIHGGYRDVELGHEALARANQSLVARNAQLRTLQRIRSSILARHDAEAVLSIVAEELEGLGFSHTTAWLIEGDTARPFPDVEYLPSFRLSGDDPISHVIRTGRPATLRSGQATDVRTTSGPAVVAAISATNGPLGVLVAERPAMESVSEPEVEAVRLFADEVALALSHASASYRAREYATFAERNRIATGIHGTVVRDLQKAEALAAGVVEEVSAATERKQLGLLRETLASSLRDLRFAVLNWTSLDWGTGAAALVQRYAREFTELSGISADLLVRGEEVMLPAHTAKDLLRVLQEALTNVWRHAEAGAVQVDLAFEPEAVSLTVNDAGKGCDPVAAEEGRGIGLKSMRRRSERHGGSMSFASAPGQGTVVKVRLPC